MTLSDPMDRIYGIDSLYVPHAPMDLVIFLLFLLLIGTLASARAKGATGGE